MGEIYYRTIWGTKRPRVALLSIGEEEMKGNEADARERATLLKQSPLNFVGNVEGPRRVSRRRGRDRLRRLHRQYRAEDQRRVGRAHRRHAEESDQEQPDIADRLCAFQRARSTISASAPTIPNMGGAPLLGVRGITVIGHGRSNRERHQERHSRGRRAVPHARERKNRTGAFRCAAAARRARLSTDGHRNRHEQTCISISRTGLAVSRHGPRPRREFSGIARGVRRSGCRAGLFAFPNCASKAPKKR